jgi:hypothetical protein
MDGYFFCFSYELRWLQLIRCYVHSSVWLAGKICLSLLLYDHNKCLWASESTHTFGAVLKPMSFVSRYVALDKVVLTGTPSDLSHLG